MTASIWTNSVRGLLGPSGAFGGGLLVLLACANSVSAQPQHRDMFQLKRFLDRADVTTVGYLKIGDSRSSWRLHRDVGSVYRQFDVPHAALVLPATEQGGNTEDGLGGLQVAVGNASWRLVLRGETGPHSGITNRYPFPLGEMWFAGTPQNPDQGFWYVLFSTCGFEMHANSLGAPGGQFKRGDPALGRPLTSVEAWFVADDQPGKWLSAFVDVGYMDPATEPPFNGAGALTEFLAAPVVSSGTGIVRRETVFEPSPATGRGIRVRLRHANDFAINKGNLLLGMRLNFAEAQTGLVFTTVADGGWSHTDHMPRSVYGPDDNPDSKYDFAQMVEWMREVFRTEYLVIDEEVGQNISTFGPFLEWNGNNSGMAQANKRIMLERWIDAAIAAGYEPSKVLVVSRIPWRGEGDDPARIDSMRAEVLSLHEQLPFEGRGVAGYVVFDQQKELEARGLAAAGGAVREEYRGDPIHQNFAGMNMLGEVFWSVIQTPICDTVDVNRDGSIFDPQDVDAFLSIFSEGPCVPMTAACGDADFNNDGSVFDPCDIDAFLLAFSEGPCSACGE